MRNKFNKNARRNITDLWHWPHLHVIANRTLTAEILRVTRCSGSWFPLGAGQTLCFSALSQRLFVTLKGNGSQIFADPLLSQSCWMLMCRMRFTISPVSFTDFSATLHSSVNRASVVDLPILVYSGECMRCTEQDWTQVPQEETGPSHHPGGVCFWSPVACWRSFCRADTGVLHRCC